MSRYRCNTWGLAGWTSYESDVDLSNEFSVSCTKIADQDPTGPVITDPEMQPPVTFTPSPTAGIEGLDPMAPGGPGKSVAWSDKVLAFLFGDDEATEPKAPASAGGCCPNGQPRCLRCWLNKNAGWLLLAGLALAAYLLRKK